MNHRTDFDETVVRKFVNYVIGKAVNGFPPLSSAHDLAQEYIIDTSYPDNEERIESLITWQTTKNFTTGFITGLGGLITLPVALPVAVTASFIIQARMVAAIAIIAGHDINSDKVQTLVLACLLGGKMSDALRDAGVKTVVAFSKGAINKIPGRTLIEINKRVGFRLLTKAGEKGVINIIKVVPVAGGLVTGGFDAAYCKMVGRTAKRVFFPDNINSVEFHKSEDLDSQTLIAKVRSGLSKLTPREEQIVRMRFGLSHYRGRKLTFEEIGKHFRLSRQTVSRHLNRALEKLEESGVRDIIENIDKYDFPFDI